MKRNAYTVAMLLATVSFGAACAGSPSSENSNATAAPAPTAEELHTASVDRTRTQIRMLDDLYKTAVVLITEHYVEDENTLSAASAAKALFAAMDESGWHQVRLVGLTDELKSGGNAPADEFESAAAAMLLAGEASHEEVVTEDGTDYLRLATPVPVVMEKCVMCHPTWEGNTGNIGALSYKVPLIE